MHTVCQRYASDAITWARCFGFVIHNCHCCHTGLALCAAGSLHHDQLEKRFGCRGLREPESNQELLMNRVIWVVAGLAAMLMSACSNL